MFSIRNQDAVTGCIMATLIINLICVNTPVLANSDPLSLIGDKPTPPQQPLSDSRPRPRARPLPRRRPNRPKRPSFPGIEDVACLGSDIAVNQKFKDEKYMKAQLNCVLNKGPCDDTGRMIKRLAPDVLKGNCPNPCNVCTRRQIKRVMAEVQRRFPRQFSEMLRSFSRRS